MPLCTAAVRSAWRGWLAHLAAHQLVDPPHGCGCCTGCRPFLMQAKMSYTKIGIFSLASYPYRQADSQRAPLAAARIEKCTDASHSRNLRQSSALSSFIRLLTHSVLHERGMRLPYIAPASKRQAGLLTLLLLPASSPPCLACTLALRAASSCCGALSSIRCTGRLWGAAARGSCRCRQHRRCSCSCAAAGWRGSWTRATRQA